MTRFRIISHEGEKYVAHEVQRYDGPIKGWQVIKTFRSKREAKEFLKHVKL